MKIIDHQHPFTPALMHIHWDENVVNFNKYLVQYYQLKLFTVSLFTVSIRCTKKFWALDLIQPK